MKRKTYRARARAQKQWDVIAGTALLAAGTIVLAAYLLFAAALDCKHARFADAPYCELVHAVVR